MQKTVVIGAGSEDIYRPVGQVSEAHRPGAKNDLPLEQYGLVPQLIAAGAHRHPGGNALNVAAYLGRSEADRRAEVHFVSVRGENDRASQFIGRYIGFVGLHDATMVVPNHRTSSGIIERRQGQDRHIWGIPRTPLDEHLTDEYLEATLQDAEAVVAASLKSLVVTRRVLEHAPKGAFISLNPGSSEVRGGYAGELQAELRHSNRRRKERLKVLALNDEELLEFMGMAEDGDPFVAAEKVTELAENVFWTRGKEGFVLSRRLNDGTVDHLKHAAALIPQARVKDPNGAGDRAHAVLV